MVGWDWHELIKLKTRKKEKEKDSFVFGSNKIKYAVVHGVVVTKESQGWMIEKNNKNSKNQKNHNVTL